MLTPRDNESASGTPSFEAERARAHLLAHTRRAEFIIHGSAPIRYGNWAGKGQSELRLKTFVSTLTLVLAMPGILWIVSVTKVRKDSMSVVTKAADMSKSPVERAT